MAQYTLTYSENSGGWPSFYSYDPEYMIGMNNYFYTFSGGNLYRHNVNPLRNTYYGVAGNLAPSTMTSVFNQAPVTNKIFKTLQIEGDDSWAATFQTDLQTGEIKKDWFEKKEFDWFAFIRYFDPTPAANAQFNLRSVGGIGLITNVVNVGGTVYTVTFDAEVGTIISDGDIFYQIDTTAAPPVTPQMAGTITAHSGNTITIDIATPVGSIIPTVAGGPPPPGNPYTNLGAYVKNALAESYGILGHYSAFTLTNDSTSPVELFSVESDIMKSYP